jgi:hypothetical protein
MGPPGSRRPARSTTRLDIPLTPSRLRVEVTDDNERPELVPPDPGEPTLGWELQHVAELADLAATAGEKHLVA